jgi:hypothetical protein
VSDVGSEKVDVEPPGCRTTVPETSVMVALAPAVSRYVIFTLIVNVAEFAVTLFCVACSGFGETWIVICGCGAGAGVGEVGLAPDPPQAAIDNARIATPA